MSSTHKKVIVRKMDRDSVQGHVPSAFLAGGKLEMLNSSGSVVMIDLKDVKLVQFVREFGEPDDMVRKTFTTRPRTQGRWVRLRFRDNDVIEGTMPNDLTQVLPEGFLINPPDSRNTQRVFVPRTALAAMTILGVIGGPVTRRRKPAPKADSRQVPMFSE